MGSATGATDPGSHHVLAARTRPCARGERVADPYPGPRRRHPNRVKVRVPTKPCARCGRTITWRAKWARAWDEVRYCSDACRAGTSAGAPHLLGHEPALEQAILTLLAARARGTTICPSAAARVVGGEDWRPLMEATRQAARRLVARGALDITQGGRVVDPSTARGPIRLRAR